jgi:hypothetical protein
MLRCQLVGAAAVQPEPVLLPFIAFMNLTSFNIMKAMIKKLIKAPIRLPYLNSLARNGNAIVFHLQQILLLLVQLVSKLLIPQHVRISPTSGIKTFHLLNAPDDTLPLNATPITNCCNGCVNQHCLSQQTP